MYSDRRGKDKLHPGQNLQDKNTRTKTPGQNAPELRQTPCKDICSLCMHVLIKMGGPRCVTTLGGLEMCDKVTGDGGKN